MFDLIGYLTFKTGVFFYYYYYYYVKIYNSSQNGQIKNYFRYSLEKEGDVTV